MSDLGGVELIAAKRLITPLAEIQDGAVVVGRGSIRFVGKEDALPNPPATRHAGHFLIPGMIDLHINGAGGADCAESTGKALSTIGRVLAKHGCTGYLATVITEERTRLLRTLESLSRRLQDRFDGATPLGIHLEGPFINPVRKGAHDPSCIQEPSPPLLGDYLRAGGGSIRMLTLAPELPGALDLIATARSRLPVVAIGHSDADFDCASEAIRRGANVAVHIFNAMTPLHHRRPGLVAAILNSSEITAEIIADGVHVHPEMVRLAFRCKGARRMALVTDAVSAAGMPDGSYRLGNLEITLNDGACRDREGHLAGSVLQMDEGLRNLREWLGGEFATPLGEIVHGASCLPAQLLNLPQKGKIEAGCDADLALLDEDLRVLKTWVNGKLCYDSSTE